MVTPIQSGGDKLFGPHANALRVLSARNEQIAANIANADTPNYKARDLDFKTLLQNGSERPVRLRATQPGHIGASGGSDPTGAALYRVPMQPSLDGNTVEADVEQAAFAENALRYQASLRFINGRIQTLRSALTGEVR